MIHPKENVILGREVKVSPAWYNEWDIWQLALWHLCSGESIMRCGRDSFRMIHLLRISKTNARKSRCYCFGEMRTPNVEKVERKKSLKCESDDKYIKLCWGLLKDFHSLNKICNYKLTGLTFRRSYHISIASEKFPARQRLVSICKFCFIWLNKYLPYTLTAIIAKSERNAEPQQQSLQVDLPFWM